MLTTAFGTLLCVLAPQGPLVNMAADAVAVRGTTELTVADAFAAARSAAVEHLEARWRERSRRLVVDQRPFWLPAMFAEQAARRWEARQSLGEAMAIVDREDRVREHEFGNSYQTTLWITEDPRHVERGERQLRRELQAAQKRTLVLSGATVGLWAFLAVAIAWIDRLSRGYMTGRLRCIGLLVGAVVPTLAFLL
jgi:hypothetical protein